MGFLLLFPLVSELEFLGIKIKKEVNKATGEIKNEVDDIKRTISIIQQNNSVYNNISFANDPLPTKAEMNDSKANRDQGSDYDRIEENMFADVDKKSVILFEARIKLESSMRKITEKVGLPDRQPIRSMLDSLIRYEIIDYETANRISKVNSIANRGVHGEIVSDEYIEYVLDTVPILIKKLQEIDSTLHLIACPRCKYNGYSNHNNTCPKCGYVFIDD